MNEEETELLSLLSTDRYNKDIIPRLESSLQSQIDQQWYSQELNLALLKLYQFHPEDAKEDILNKILLKAIMQLPNPDFQLALCMLPQTLQAIPSVSHIIEIAQQLQGMRLETFWSLMKTHENIIKLVPGFELCIRKFILSVGKSLYRDQDDVTFAHMLGFGNNVALFQKFLSDINQDSDEQKQKQKQKQKEIEPKTVTKTAAEQSVNITTIAKLVRALETN